MGEYWKSTPRFWCKQCKIFIRDTPFEKSQHEATAKHQGNLKRFLREIHRDNERQQRESQKAKSEVERLRQTVSGSSSGKSSELPGKRAVPAPKPAERPASLEERKKQMAQLADMGIAIPEEFRGEMSMAGEWQTVSQRVIGQDDDETPDKSGLSIGVRKRKHEGDEDEDEDQETKMFVSKGWGSRFREYPGAQEDDDLDALLESTKDIKKVKPTASDATAQEASTKHEAPVKHEETGNVPESDHPSGPKEDEASAADKSATPPIKSEAEDAAPGVVFKKRKPKAMRK
ncbi:formin binding protein [Aspergillus sclerotialis]|uniref:Formin binding protein n=1 Tax=Aspergillus sclerotialis TaxID=2070753 RepID=A0A3A2ZIC6_9EURO|nr:formin binding protein [Aspergillus sclerotialis]